MKYTLVIFLIGTNEPVTVDCESTECQDRFRDILVNGVTVERGQQVEFYPPSKIDHIKAKPKRTKLNG